MPRKKEIQTPIKSFIADNGKLFSEIKQHTFKSGEIYLQACAAVANLHSQAKVRKILPEFGRYLELNYDITRSAIGQMLVVNSCWGWRSQEERNVFCSYFGETNKCKLVYISGLFKQAEMGRDHKVDRFHRIKISTKTSKIFVVLKSPSEKIELDDFTFLSMREQITDCKIERNLTVHEREAIITQRINGTVDKLLNAVKKIDRDLFNKLMANRHKWDSEFVGKPGNQVPKSKRPRPRARVGVSLNS